VDSLTQLASGAAVGEAVLGRRVGRKAMFWGAVLGTLPDLDVFIPLGSPVEDFVYHRGFSHSVFLLAALSPLAGWLISRVHRSTREHLRGWVLLAFLVFESAVLLDLLTVYGTRILWPFDNTPLAWPILFIVDPLFTLPLVGGVLAALLMTRKKPVGRRLNAIGLAMSMVYLVWAGGVREFADHRVESKLARQDVPYTALIASPAPFTTFLHRYVGLDGDRYFETYYSIFDGDAPLAVRHYPRNLALLEGLEHHPPVEQLQWFSRGFYAPSRKGGDIVVSDLRMGSEPFYVFTFAVARDDGAGVRPIPPEQQRMRVDRRQLGWVWKRIWQPLPTPG